MKRWAAILEMVQPHDAQVQADVLKSVGFKVLSGSRFARIFEGSSHDDPEMDRLIRQELKAKQIVQVKQLYAIDLSSFTFMDWLLSGKILLVPVVLLAGNVFLLIAYSYGLADLIPWWMGVVSLSSLIISWPVLRFLWKRSLDDTLRGL
jgi:hypothetical protein